ncbi:unnamed protein product [Lota lota]
MDRDLLRQCLTYHGESLFNTLQCEQTENPDFQAVASDLAKATYERGGTGEGSPLVEQFIARKADILFCPTWKTAIPREEELADEEAAEPYAIMPPAEAFMEVPFEERRAMLYRDLERGDAVVGRINNVREYGFFLTLLCAAGGLKRDMEDLELSALCHIKEIPSTGSHDDPLSYYQIGDLIRAGVKDLDRYQEKITVSLLPSSLCPRLAHIKLGVIAREELPKHYSRGLRVADDTRETYERLLRSCHGYHNPLVVEYLLGRVGVSDERPPSLMRGLQSKHFHEEDFASVIRKKQSASWALKCVRSGVDHFKHGRHVEAMNEYNKALEIDPRNVEALVARGALYANKGGMMKAISDFELGLETCPDHRNAKKYLCQTLVERGKQLQEQEKFVTAEGLYRRALSLDGSYPEAQAALRRITDTIQKSIRLREEAVAKETEKAKSGQTSAEKLRKILKEEKRMKRKRKRSSSSSSSSPSEHPSLSPTSTASSRRRSKKRRRKRGGSDRGSQRHRRRSSRDDGTSRRKRRAGEEEEEEEEYPAPPNTSATFLYRPGFLGSGSGRGEGGGGEDDDDEEEEVVVDDRRICQLYSLSAASEDEGSDHRGGDSSRSNREGRKGKKDREERSFSSDGTGGRRSRRESRRESSSDRSACGAERERGKARRRSNEGRRRRKASTSSLESQRSRKSNVAAERPQACRRSSSVSQGQQPPPPPSSRRTSLDGGRSQSRPGRGPEQRVEGAGGGDGHRAQAASTSNGQGGAARPPPPPAAGGGAGKKELPPNLMDIFNKIAQFEKEKGVGPRK